MWLKYYDDSSNLSAVTGRLRADSIVRLRGGVDTANYYTVFAVTSDGITVRLLPGSAQLGSYAESLAKIDDILVNGN